MKYSTDNNESICRNTTEQRPGLPRLSSIRIPFLAVSAILFECLAGSAGWHAVHGAEQAKTFALFNGKDLNDWRLHGNVKKNFWKVGTATVNPTDPTKLVVLPGGTDLINAGDHGADLVTTACFGDAILELEFMIPRQSNSGIVLMGMYEIQVLDRLGDTEPKMDGMASIYKQAAPLVNASKEPGQWQKLTVEYHAPRFDKSGRKIANARIVNATLNGRIIHDNVEVKTLTCPFLSPRETPTGPLFLQGDHGPVAFRNIRVTPTESEQ